MADELVRRWVRPEIRALSAYHVPDAGGMVKLDAMENPWSFEGEARQGWLEALAGVEVNRYPDPAAGRLKGALREAFGVPAGAELLLGNGSDEIIQMLCMAVAGPDRVVMAPEPSFVMYRMIATFCGMPYHGVPLRADDFALDGEALLAAIRDRQPALLFLAYPNNPTGNLFDRELMERVLDQAPGLVVVDEAYSAFTDETFLPLAGERPNLLVMRTLSKMGLAGLRLGWLAGPAVWIAELEKIRLPYNINSLTQAGASWALEHREILDRQTARLRQERARLLERLAALPAIHPWPSEANFILFRTPAGCADALFDGLKGRGILIKNLSPAGGPLRDCLRVTVGRPEENDAFLDALTALLADRS
ncbi:MAG TPA: histidinol-phosphate transaminase [Thiotrichales bacterium]|nr:histidinol-phosphate transaminase [Thiotrichales bacterium]